MKRNPLSLISITFIVVLFISGCQIQFPSITLTPVIPKLATKNPHVRGIIQDIFTKDGKVTSIYIAGKNDSDTIVDKAYVAITAKTLIYSKINSEYKVINPEDLTVGENAAVLFIGPIADSYPVQAYADEILVNR